MHQRTHGIVTCDTCEEEYSTPGAADPFWGWEPDDDVLICDGCKGKGECDECSRQNSATLMIWEDKTKGICTRLGCFCPEHRAITLEQDELTEKDTVEL